MQKNQYVKRLHFSLNTNKLKYLENYPLKIACSRPWPQVFVPSPIQNSPSVYNKNTTKWSSNAQIWNKYELYTPKPSQLHETVQQKCYCKISYGTTIDYYDPQAISQWFDTSYPLPPSLNQRNGCFWLVQLEKLNDVTLVRPKWIISIFSSTMETMVGDRSCSMPMRRKTASLSPSDFWVLQKYNTISLIFP